LSTRGTLSSTTRLDGPFSSPWTMPSKPSTASQPRQCKHECVRMAPWLVVFTRQRAAPQAPSHNRSNLNPLKAYVRTCISVLLFTCTGCGWTERRLSDAIIKQPLPSTVQVRTQTLVTSRFWFRVVGFSGDVPHTHGDSRRSLEMTHPKNHVCVKPK
jgi:hypothetical protein